MADRRSLNLVRIGGIQITIDVSWLVIFLLVLVSLSAGYFPVRHPGHPAAAYWVTGLAATVLFFLSVLVHELSHAIVGNRLGQEVRQITLFIFGGMAHLSGEPRTPADEIKIAAVGPLTSLVLGGAFWALAEAAEAVSPPPLAVAVLRYLAFINVALAVFNLLPGFPLDGGRLLRAALWQRSGNLRAATARAADWGGGIGLGLMLLGGLEIFLGALVGGLWLIFIGMFLRTAASAGYYSVTLEESLRGRKVRDVMVSDPVTVDAHLSVAEAIEAYFLRHGYTAFPVLENGRLLGLLSLSGVQQCPAGERASRRVSEVMQPLDERNRIDPSATLAEALRRMGDTDRGRLLVTDGDELRGLITRSGILRFVHVRGVLEERGGAG